MSEKDSLRRITVVTAAAPRPRVPARTACAPSPRRGGRGQFRVHDAERGEPPGADQYAGFQRADRLVVGADRRRQRLADPVHVASHAGQPLVQLPAELEHRPRVLRERLLLPGVLGGAQHRHQRRGVAMCTRRASACSSSSWSRSRAGARNASPGMNRITNSGVSGSADQYAFDAELVHVRPQLPGVRVEPRFPHRVVRRRRRLQVGGERHLGVDDHVLAAGQPDHHVRPLPALHDHLLVEVHVRGHPGQFDDPAQLELAPAAAGLGPPQRGDQRLGLLAELFRAAPGELDLLGELGVRPGPRDVGFAQLLLDAGQRLPHGRRPASPRRNAARAARRRARCARSRCARSARPCPPRRGRALAR